MSYCTAANVKSYAGISSTTDDVLIADLISRAQKIIETYTNRVFEAASDTTRYFGMSSVWGRDLLFDQDLCAITTVKTNADNASPSTIPSTDYVTLPRNFTPYYGIRLLSSSSYDWEYTSNPEGAIQIVGRFAYSTTAPDDIVQAAVRLSTFLYRQKDSQVFDTTALPDSGVIMIPQGIPADVKVILDPYRKRVAMA